MDFWEQIVELARRHHLRFLVIGGHAVFAYGYERTTRDVDILVCKEDAAGWRAAIQELGYTVYYDGGSFIQYNPAAADAWPLDLMLVNPKTFDGMWADAVQQNFGKTQIPIVSLRHLLALKVFALKDDKPHRALKDMDDMINLLTANKVNVQDQWFRDLVIKYGTVELYDKLRHALE